MQIETTRCCGIDEIANIKYNRNNNEEILFNLCKNRYSEDDGGDCAFYFFSDTDEEIEHDKSFEFGLSLKKYIRDNKLGIVTQSTKRINPNTDHTLIMWVWAVNNDKLFEWFEKHGGEIGMDDDDDDEY